MFHNQINVLSPSFLRSPLSGGQLMLKVVVVGNGEVEEHLKVLTDV